MVCSFLPKRQSLLGSFILILKKANAGLFGQPVPFGPIRSTFRIMVPPALTCFTLETGPALQIKRVYQDEMLYLTATKDLQALAQEEYAAAGGRGEWSLMAIGQNQYKRYSLEEQAEPLRTLHLVLATDWKTSSLKDEIPVLFYVTRQLTPPPRPISSNDTTDADPGYIFSYQGLSRAESGSTQIYENHAVWVFHNSTKVTTNRRLHC